MTDSNTCEFDYDTQLVIYETFLTNYFNKVIYSLLSTIALLCPVMNIPNDVAGYGMLRHSNSQ